MQTILTGALGAFLIGFALPAAAQTGMCGGRGDAGQWLGGDPAGSDIATSATALDANGIAGANETITSLFTLSAAMDVRVEALPQPGHDSLIELYAADGTLLLSDDDGGGGLASKAETFLQPGDYCLVTRGLEGSALTAGVRVGRTEHDALTDGGRIDEADTGCTADTAAQVLGFGPVDAALDEGLSETAAANMTRYYRFEIAEPQRLTLSASNEAADPVLTLYDDAGLLLLENDDADGLNSRIDMTEPLAAGRYCLGVRAIADESAPITVEVRRYSEAAYLQGLYDRAEASPPMDGSHPITDLGLLDTRLRQDLRVGDSAVWLSFEVAGDSVVLIDAIALDSLDPVLTLYDDLGRKAGYNDDAGAGDLNSLLAARVSTGIYLLAVTRVDSSEGPVSPGTVRLAVERYVRAR